MDKEKKAYKLRMKDFIPYSRDRYAQRVSNRYNLDQETFRFCAHRYNLLTLWENIFTVGSVVAVIKGLQSLVQ